MCLTYIEVQYGTSPSARCYYWINGYLRCYLKVISTSFDQEDHLKDLVTTKRHKVWISRHIFNDISCNHYTFQPTTLSNIEVSIAIIPLKFEERNRYVVQLSNALLGSKVYKPYFLCLIIIETKMRTLGQGKNCNWRNCTSIQFLLLLKKVLLRTIAMLFCMPYSTFCVTITNNMKVILMGNLSFIVLFL